MKKIFLLPLAFAFVSIASAQGLSLPNNPPLFPPPEDSGVFNENINTRGNQNNLDLQADAAQYNQGSAGNPSPESPAPAPAPAPTPMPPPVNDSPELAENLPPTSTTVIENGEVVSGPEPGPGEIAFVQDPDSPWSWGIVSPPAADGSIVVDGVPLNENYTILNFENGGSTSFTTGTSGTDIWQNVNGDYIPNVGDVVLFQEGDGNSIWGVVTSTGGADGFTINGSQLNLNSNYKITKLSGYEQSSTTVNSNGSLADGMDFQVGDWVLYNTGNGYVWGVVTSAEYVGPGGVVRELRINNQPVPPGFLAGSRVTKVRPPAGIDAPNVLGYWFMIILGTLGLAGALAWAYYRVRKKK